MDKTHKKRLLKEYKELKERYSKLHKMLVEYDAKKNRMAVKNIRIMRKQAKAMGNYLYCLEVRAKMENIELI